MTKRTCSVLLWTWIVTCPLFAQQDVLTGPVLPTDKLTWLMTSSVDTAVAAQALEYRLRDNGGAFLAVAGVTCAGTALPFNCQATLTAPLVSLLNTAGIHNLTLSAYTQSAGLESAQSVPFVLKSPPTAPTGLRLSR